MTPLSPTTERRLLRAIIEGRQDLVQLARQQRIPVPVLAQWARKPAIRKVIRGALELVDLQTQLAAARYRAVAVSKLIRMISADDMKPDIARRACVDLLTITVAPPTDPPPERKLYKTASEAHAAQMAELMGVLPPQS